MIICNARYGQLSNRLILLAHCMSTAFENNDKIRLTTFDDLKDSYNCADDAGLVTIKSSVFWNTEAKLQKILKRDLTFGHIRVVSSWLYRDYINVEKHGDSIRKFFSPKEELIHKAQLFYSTIKINAGGGML